jgi:hypothetical protein
MLAKLQWENEQINSMLASEDPKVIFAAFNAAATAWHLIDWVNTFARICSANWFWLSGLCTSPSRPISSTPGAGARKSWSRFAPSATLTKVTVTRPDPIAAQFYSQAAPRRPLQQNRGQEENVCLMRVFRMMTLTCHRHSRPPRRSPGGRVPPNCRAVGRQ